MKLKMKGMNLHWSDRNDIDRKWKVVGFEFLSLFFIEVLLGDLLYQYVFTPFKFAIPQFSHLFLII